MGLVLRYPDCRSIFKHPDNKEEFKKIFSDLLYFKSIKDIDGMYTAAMQLIPMIIEEENSEYVKH